MNTVSSLVRIGLTRNEAKVYICLLKIIEGTAFQISKRSDIPRTTTYTALESLKAQGLVTSFRKNNVLYFTAENPKQILTILKHKQELMDELLPSLQALSVGTDIQPSVKMFTGTQGMKLAFEDILETLERTGQKTLYAAAYPGVMDALPKYYHAWVKRREELGVHTKMIVPESTRNQKLFYEGHNREVRFMPEPYLYQSAMDIYANKIVYFSVKEGTTYSIIVESPTIADAFLKFFLFAFDHLPK
ncbi:MAG: helix-turn-helix domain-containing protein [Candidatus Uhrbacteria bacterium]|nr:helix-turn-helix domain-containing protein [Candidatus Uhrbacteria bacterium]